MDNPLTQAPPEDEIERVHAFARDLAYGASNGLWHTYVQWQKLLKPDISAHSKIFAENLRPKWGETFPSEYLLLSFGYLERMEGDSGFSSYLLTDKAFALLEKPAAAPNVFISYRRGHSTALALYLEARLRLAGNHEIFVDKALEPGSKWRDELETKIRESRYLIALCTHGTFDSDWVRRELDIAKASNCRIIPVLHPAGREPFTNSHMPADMGDYQTIKVQDATAAEYETAANKLLSYMGYATY